MKDNFVKALGNVHINQGDTLSLRSRYAEYNGNTQFAFASGEVVLQEPNTTLTTDTLYFDRIKQQAYYRSGGKVVDTASTLTSRVGRYFAEAKKYQFVSQVVLTNPEYIIHTNQLIFYRKRARLFVWAIHYHRRSQYGLL